MDDPNTRPLDEIPDDDRTALRRDQLSAVVLAGGRSRRMGRPKPWLPLAGVPLLAAVVARVRPLVSEIVVVAAAGHELPACEARMLYDPEPNLGPLPALALGLDAVRTSHAFALGCDAPFVRRAVLRLLTREIGDLDGAVPLWGDRLQPLVALYHRRLAPTLATMASAGERRLQAVAALPRVATVSAERLRLVDPEGISFRTLNTPEDYAAACAASSDVLDE
ncbi:MAG: molybdenum cofactor guanylyltransferase [Deltaproteobacteria bacterium]|nr:molybdenum cofactor guanylyltransferase [Deltaproteobacteria bacterium]